MERRTFLMGSALALPMLPFATEQRVFLCATDDQPGNDMRDPHLLIIHHHRKVKRRHAIRFADHEILHLRRRKTPRQSSTS